MNCESKRENPNATPQLMWQLKPRQVVLENFEGDGHVWLRPQQLRRRSRVVVTFYRCL